MTPTHPKPQLRRIIACARTMMRLHGWSRRRAIRFALEKYRRDPSPPRIRRAMSGEAQEYLSHRHRSVVRGGLR